METKDFVVFDADGHVLEPEKIKDRLATIQRGFPVKRPILASQPTGIW
jgi:hypothetical protein